MIIVELNGGLGNQMFQYAVGRALALKRRMSLVLDTDSFQRHPLRRYRLGHYNIHARTLKRFDRALFNSPKLPFRVVRGLGHQGITPLRFTVIDEAQYGIYDERVATTPGHLYLRGYWQLPTYFAEIAAELQQDFTPTQPLSALSVVVAQHIRAVNAVSIHIRRGDYVNDAATNARHGTMSPDYYYQAMTRIAQQVSSPHFFLFSDEPEWAKAHLHADFPLTIVDHNRGDRDYEDLYLLRLCKHHIIANSTFSWWGAWLSDAPSKTIIAPEQWFKSGESNVQDLVPETWLRL